MYSTQIGGKQTGQVSRIRDTRAGLAPAGLNAQIRAGTNPKSPVRNELAGAGVVGSALARLFAWFRGER
jgi:hypothetical protein